MWFWNFNWWTCKYDWTFKGICESKLFKRWASKKNELVYHLNPSLRTFVSVTQDDLDWVYERYIFYKNENENLVKRFVIPQGGICSWYCHVILSKFKSVVRLLYRHKQNGNEFDNILFNFFNLLSGYFFALAIKFNKDEGIAEKEFISKNY